MPHCETCNVDTPINFCSTCNQPIPEKEVTKPTPKKKSLMDEIDED